MNQRANLILILACCDQGIAVDFPERADDVALQAVLADFPPEVFGERIVASRKLTDGDTAPAAQSVVAETEGDAAPDDRQGDEAEHQAKPSRSKPKA
jgi:hypothetical protein